MGSLEDECVLPRGSQMVLKDFIGHFGYPTHTNSSLLGECGPGCWASVSEQAEVGTVGVRDRADLKASASAAGAPGALPSKPGRALPQQASSTPFPVRGRSLCLSLWKPLPIRAAPESRLSLVCPT